MSWLWGTVGWLNEQHSLSPENSVLNCCSVEGLTIWFIPPCISAFTALCKWIPDCGGFMQTNDCNIAVLLNTSQRYRFGPVMNKSAWEWNVSLSRPAHWISHYKNKVVLNLFAMYHGWDDPLWRLVDKIWLPTALISPLCADIAIYPYFVCSEYSICHLLRAVYGVIINGLDHLEPTLWGSIERANGE